MVSIRLKIAIAFFICCVAVAVVLMLGMGVRERFIKFRSLYTPPCLQRDQLDPIARARKHRMGADHLRESSVVVCGLLRNGETKIATMKEMIHRVTSQFKTYKVLIVENDSDDGTRERLLEWHMADPNVTVLGCGTNADKCTMNLMRTRTRLPEPGRIQKMAFLRNVYMEELDQPQYRCIDYVCVLDLDLAGDLYLDGLWDSGAEFANNADIDALCANGMKSINFGMSDKTLYSDSYAHDEGNAGQRDFMSHSLMTWNKVYRVGDPLARVRSCFGGMTLYRYASIVGKRYSTGPGQRAHPFTNKRYDICEHVGLHDQLSRVYVNPGMSFIFDNDLFT